MQNCTPTVELATLERFRIDVAGLLAADPIGTNVMATVSASPGAASARDARWIVVRAGSEPEAEVIGAAFRTPPYPLGLPAMPDAAVRAVAHALHERGDVVTELSGDVAATAAFARCWSELTGATAELTSEMGVHVLGELVPPSGVAGAARPATPADAALVEAWLVSFDGEAYGREDAPRHPDPQTFAARLAAGQFVLWELAGQPVSLAGWRAPCEGVGRVGPVYTPPEHRRHGFAAGATAAASHDALDAGAERVMLFTDLANLTSNGVYARLGYQQVARASEWTLTPR